MADGAILVIDAQEGPMPQTKFVLKKALEIGLKPIVVINKIDKPASRIEEVIEMTHELFLDLATDVEQLEFPVYYAISREGKAWSEPPADFTEAADLGPLFEGILEHVPAPGADVNAPFQMLIASLDRDDFQGKFAIGRIKRGKIAAGTMVTLIKKDGAQETARVDRVYVSYGLKRLETEEAVAGDIVALTGVGEAGIGETLADPAKPEALPTIMIEEPTLKISVSANTSPFAGREGQFVTSRQIRARIMKELETNVALKFAPGDAGNFIISGRGELHLSVFIETLRREGYELEAGKPLVITKEIDGRTHEPIEELTIDVAADYTGAIISEIGQRKGTMLAREENTDNSTRLIFEITTRGLLGLRSRLLTLSRGTAVMNSLFLRYEPQGAALPRLRNGALFASEAGKAVAYGLNNAQGRGTVFITPQTQVYEGMIIGLNSRESDLGINVAKEKKLTNVRAAGSDDSITLTPPTALTLEQSLDFLEDDELLEVTPESLRLRKKILRAGERARAAR